MAADPSPAREVCGGMQGYHQSLPAVDVMLYNVFVIRSLTHPSDVEISRCVWIDHPQRAAAVYSSTRARTSKEEHTEEAPNHTKWCGSERKGGWWGQQRLESSRVGPTKEERGNHSTHSDVKTSGVLKYVIEQFDGS